MATEKISELELRIEDLYKEAIRTKDKEAINVCKKALKDLRDENTNNNDNPQATTMVPEHN